MSERRRLRLYLRWLMGIDENRSEWRGLGLRALKRALAWEHLIRVVPIITFLVKITEPNLRVIEHKVQFTNHFSNGVFYELILCSLYDSLFYFIFI